MVNLTKSLEVLDCSDLQFHSSIFVAKKDGILVHLEGAHREHVTDTALDGLVKGVSLVGSRDQNHHLKHGHVVVQD